MGWSPSTDTLAKTLRKHEKILTALVTTPQLAHSSIKNGYTQVLSPTGQIQAVFGDYTFTTGPCAGQQVSGVITFNVATGLPQTFQGSLSWPFAPYDGNMAYGLFTFDSNGNPVLLQGSQPDGSFGEAIWNPATGAKQALFGQISSSPAIYGAAVLPYGGTELQQVGGSIAGAIVSALNVTNTSYSGFTPSGNVSAEVGPSGQADVTVRGTIATGVGGQQGIVGISVDGGSPSGYLAASSSAGGVQIIASSTITVSGLAPGVHNFTPAYFTANNGSATVSFEGVQVTVQPL